MIVTSSTMGFFSMPACSVYASSKAFLNSFVMAVEDELTTFKEKVDLLLYCPGFVRTQMIDGCKDRPTVSIQICTAEDSVRCALRDLGYKQDNIALSFGTLKHDLIA